MVITPNLVGEGCGRESSSPKSKQQFIESNLNSLTVARVWAGLNSIPSISTKTPTAMDDVASSHTWSDVYSLLLTLALRLRWAQASCTSLWLDSGVLLRFLAGIRWQACLHLLAQAWRGRRC